MTIMTTTTRICGAMKCRIVGRVSIVEAAEQTRITAARSTRTQSDPCLPNTSSRNTKLISYLHLVPTSFRRIITVSSESHHRPCLESFDSSALLHSARATCNTVIQQYIKYPPLMFVCISSFLLNALPIPSMLF
jgi:hypothetical protein